MSAETVVLELAGLLKSGMPANLAREELRPELETMNEIQRAQLESVWSLAQSAGGSISGSIQSLGETFLATAKRKREIELAFAGPKATARMVAWLPGAGLALAQMFGLNPVSAIISNPIAFLSMAVGVALLVVGRVWTRSILDKAKPSEADPGIYFDSVRFGMLAGLPLTSAVESATASVFQHLNVQPDDSSVRKIDRMAALNRISGASIADLLAAEANVCRETQAFDESNALAKLSVRLMIPLGAVTLPAFVLSTIVPIAISLLSNRQS